MCLLTDHSQDKMTLPVDCLDSTKIWASASWLAGNTFEINGLIVPFSAISATDLR